MEAELMSSAAIRLDEVAMCLASSSSRVRSTPRFSAPGSWKPLLSDPTVVVPLSTRSCSPFALDLGIRDIGGAVRPRGHGVSTSLLELLVFLPFFFSHGSVGSLQSSAPVHKVAVLISTHTCGCLARL